MFSVHDPGSYTDLYDLKILNIDDLASFSYLFFKKNNKTALIQHQFVMFNVLFKKNLLL